MCAHIKPIATHTHTNRSSTFHGVSFSFSQSTQTHTTSATRTQHQPHTHNISHTHTHSQEFNLPRCLFSFSQTHVWGLVRLSDSLAHQNRTLRFVVMVTMV